MVQTEKANIQNYRFSRVKGKTPRSSCNPTFLDPHQVADLENVYVLFFGP